MLPLPIRKLPYRCKVASNTYSSSIHPLERALLYGHDSRRAGGLLADIWSIDEAPTRPAAAHSRLHRGWLAIDAYFVVYPHPHQLRLGMWILYRLLKHRRQPGTDCEGLRPSNRSKCLMRLSDERSISDCDIQYKDGARRAAANIRASTPPTARERSRVTKALHSVRTSFHCTIKLKHFRCPTECLIAVIF